ncbi:MAG: SWIB/MDM2 domain-containing protein [Chitinophagaceae bacterium]
MAKAASKTTKKATKAPTKEAGKPASKTPAKAASKTAKPAAKKASGKANAGFMAPLNVSPELAKVVGKGPYPRTEITKKIWDYIKSKDLQDKNNRRMINADETLKVVFDGKDQVSMFDLAKLVNKHVK